MVFFKTDKKISWDPAKNLWLQENRGIVFEELLNGNFIGIDDHSSRGHQQLLLIEYHGYIWVIPYVENAVEIFFKTAFQSRKYTRKYLGGN